MLDAAVVNGLFQLFAAGVERSAIISRTAGVPIEKVPDILDAMFAESKAARDQAINEAKE